MKELPPLSTRRSAFSLIIILAVLVLLSSLLIAFLAKSRMELQATVSYSNSIEANALAKGAAEEVAAGLSAEAVLAAGSTDLKPALTLARVGSNSTNPRVSNLIRRSVGKADVFQAGYTAVNQTKPEMFASDISSTAVSQNGRKISLSRWNAPLLLSGSSSFEDFTAPDWVIVTRAGSKSVSDGDVVNLRNLEDSNNNQAALGRYAYMLYDLSGLLDANLAGSPASDTDARRSQKGGQSSADLTPVFATSSSLPDAFLNWRQGSLARVYGTDPVAGSIGAPGELEIGPRATQSTGNRFISRQDMLRFMKNYGGGTVFPQALAPLFTTYSIAANGPEIIQCLTAQSANSAYRLSGTVAVSIPSYRVESMQNVPYQIEPGASLFARKFPLSRLRWFSDVDNTGKPTDKAQAAIKQHFGLTWVGNLADAGITSTEYQNVPGYIYTSPDAVSGNTTAATAIKTLAQVAALGTHREPDFFEWLKEAINTGSVGVSGGPTNTLLPGYLNSENTQELSKDFQLIQIGANIIDQSDFNDSPTLVGCGAAADRNGRPLVAFGVENLPYINELFASFSMDPGAAGGPAINAWIQPEIWCPHANVGKPRVDSAGNAITSFRMRAVGGRPSIDANYLIREPVTNKGIASVAEYSRQRRTMNVRTFTGAAIDTLSMTISGTSYTEPGIYSTAVSTNTILWGTSVTTRPGPAPWQAGFQGLLAGSTTVGSRIFEPDLRFPVDSQLGSVEDPGLPGFTYPIGKRLYNEIFLSFDPYYRPDNVPGGSPATFVMEALVNNKWTPYQSWESLQRFPGEAQNPDDRYSANSAWSFGFAYDATSGWQKPALGEPDPYPTGNGLTEKFFYGWNVVGARASMAKSDPRTRRFGTGSAAYAMPGVGIRDTSADWTGLGTPANATSSSRFANWDCRELVPMGALRAVAPNYTITQSPAVAMTSTPGTVWTFLRTASSRVCAPLADLARNSDDSKSCMYYKDPDGTLRPADYRYIAAANFPTITGQKASRPVILNRPFRNVAELGYVFRDTPWKSLDMMTSKGTAAAKPTNADLGLLNVFCIEDTVTTEGKVNPFIARQEIIEAIFRGAEKNANDAARGTLSSADANTTATAFISNINSSSADKAFSSDIINVLNQITEPTDANRKIKIEAEAYARALSGVSNRRSWTLMLDVIAQAGRFPLSAKSLQDFVVTGERRYWVYITLDRYTGQVINMDYEPVYE